MSTGKLLKREAKKITLYIKRIRNAIKSLEYMKEHSQKCIEYNRILEQERQKERRKAYKERI